MASAYAASQAACSEAGSGAYWLRDKSRALCVQGPADTPFAGGCFELAIRVPEQYPLVPPTMSFKTKIFHPNVHFKVSMLPS